MDNLKKFIDASEVVVLNGFDILSECNDENRDVIVKEQKTLCDAHLAALRLLMEMEDSEKQLQLDKKKFDLEMDKYELEVEKKEIEEANQKNAIRKEIVLEASALLVSTGLSIAGMIFYKHLYEEGLLFETDGTIASGYVRNLTNKMTDWMKAKK